MPEIEGAQQSPRSDPAAPACMTTEEVNRSTWLASMSRPRYLIKVYLEAVSITGREDYEMTVFPPTTSSISSLSIAFRHVAPVYISACTQPQCRE